MKKEIESLKDELQKAQAKIEKNVENSKVSNSSSGVLGSLQLELAKYKKNYEMLVKFLCQYIKL